MIFSQPIPQWISMTALATVAGKYMITLQSLSITDVCSLNPTTLYFWHNLAPSLHCIPEEQFTVSMMLNASPPTHPAISTALKPLLHSHSYTPPHCLKNRLDWIHKVCLLFYFCWHALEQDMGAQLLQQELLNCHRYKFLVKQLDLFKEHEAWNW